MFSQESEIDEFVLNLSKETLKQINIENRLRAKKVGMSFHNVVIFFIPNFFCAGTKTTRKENEESSRTKEKDTLMYPSSSFFPSQEVGTDS